MKQIPLTKIGFFNPGRLSDEEIEQNFISRIPFFEYLFKKIVDEPPNSIPQHYLVIGQRGMGKTSLLMRIAAELRKSPHKQSFIALSFPEEQYNIDRLSKFWLNCLDALADALDKENNKEQLAALDIDISNLSKGNNIEANGIYEKFKIWTKKINRRPILLVDNLNLVFEKLNKQEQHQLRAILISNDAPILVGASATSIDETIDYGAPFYDGFQISYLKKLSFDESLAILQNLAKITGNIDFENIFLKQKGRLEALYLLTGGTPRILSILFPLIHNGFSNSIQTDLDALLDAITPLYKAKFDELAPQLQVILDAVALNWDPINLEQLRKITQLENAQLSPQLKRLIEMGWLQKLDAYKAKGGAYEISERFFNIWYLMRRSSRRQKRELYCLTKFLEIFYGDGINEIAQNRISSKSETVTHITFDLALADAVKSAKMRTSLRKKSYQALMDLSLNDGEILKNFEIPKDISNKKIFDLLNEADHFYESKLYGDAETVLKKILNIDAKVKQAWANLGVLYQHYFEKFEQAEMAFNKALEIEDKDADIMHSLGDLYHYKLINYKNAEIAYINSLAINEKDASVLYELGMLYHYKLNRYSDAENFYKKAIEIDDKQLLYFINLGFLYDSELKKFSEAEAIYIKATTINDSPEIAWAFLGNLYQYSMYKYTESELAFKKSIEINGKYEYAWSSLGNLYVNHLKQYIEAEAAYKKALEMDNSDANLWCDLGDLYFEHLGKYSEAESAYKRAIEIDGNNFYYWYSLGNLYQSKLGNYLKAELAYKKSIDIDAKSFYSWIGLGDIYLNHLSNYTEAEKAYEKALQINEKSTSAWNGLGNFYHDYAGDYDKAENAYKKAIEVDKSNFCAVYNLVFLWRDKMNRIQDAKDLFNTLDLLDEFKDSYYLNLALFEYYQKNVGNAEAFIEKALGEIGGTLPADTQDDWYRSAAVLIKLNYGESLLKVLSANGFEIILRPYFIAIEAMTKKEDDLFLNSVALEVREPAKIIIDIIRNYIK